VRYLIAGGQGIDDGGSERNGTVAPGASRAIVAIELSDNIFARLLDLPRDAF
jgi:hypothetical protein